MTILPILFWILIVLAAIGAIFPFGGPHAPRINSAFFLLLLALLGLRVFPISLN